MTQIPLRPERQGRPAPEALATRRQAIATLTPPYPIRPGVTVSSRTRDGVPCVELAPQQTDRTILYLHGGGYRVGHPEGWVGFASLLAEQAQARIVLPDYRLAPEHPFPAALNDATAVLTSVTEEHGPPIVAGDSAGGGLAAALVLVARATQLPAPLGTILISPWLDLTQSAETFGSNADCDLFFPLAVAIEAAEQYLQGHSASDPFASPLFADVADFPPSLILAGGDEALLADATRFVGRLALAGRHVEAMFVAEMQHTWPNLFPDLPESMDAIAAMAGFAIRATRR